MNFDVNFPENNIRFTVEMEQVVDKKIEEKTICQNGIYNAEEDGAHGYNPVTVAVPTYEEENARLNEELSEKTVQLQAEQDAFDAILTRSAQSVSNDRVTAISYYVFYSWTNLLSADFPKVTAIASRGFAYTGLTSIDLPCLQRITGKMVFAYCTSLKKVVLRNSAVVSDPYTDTFTGTPIADGTGFIYVPDDLVEAYKTATNWSVFANQIKPISELEA